MHTIIEPFRVKMTEALPITTRGHREPCLASVHNNVFLLDAEDISIDFSTRSGTGAMAARRCAALMPGDERRERRCRRIFPSARIRFD
jgi:tryptophanase